MSTNVRRKPISQPEEEQLGVIAKMLGRHMNRRGFLGTASKGALVVAAAISGVMPFGSQVQVALACWECEGCTSPCQSGTASCSHNYWHQGSGPHSAECSVDCQLAQGEPYCKAHAPAGFFPYYYSACPCGSRSCG